MTDKETSHSRPPREERIKAIKQKYPYIDIRSHGVPKFDGPGIFDDDPVLGPKMIAERKAIQKEIDEAYAED